MTDHRRRDDYTLDQLRNEIGSFANRLEVIEAAVTEIDRRLYDHMRHEDESMIHLHECLHANTQKISAELKAIRDSVNELRENLFPLTLKDAGQGLWSLGEWMQKAVLFWTPIVTFILIAGAIFFWWIGQGQFPK